MRSIVRSRWKDEDEEDESGSDTRKGGWGLSHSAVSNWKIFHSKLLVLISSDIEIPITLIRQ